MEKGEKRGEKVGKGREKGEKRGKRGEKEKRVERGKGKKEKGKGKGKWARQANLSGGLSLRKADGWNLKNHSHLTVARDLREKTHPSMWS